MNADQSAQPAGASTVASPTTQHSNHTTSYPTSTAVAATAAATTTSAATTASTSAASEVMATPGFLPPTHALRSAISIPTPYSSTMLFDREATKPVGTPFSNPPSPMVRVLIRRLPLNTSEESLRLMVVWSKELADVELLPVEQSEDAGFRSALLKFRSMAGAREAKNMLDGRSNISNDAEMVVEILSNSPVSARRYPSDTNPPSSASSSASSGPGSRQTSRFNGTFQSLESISPQSNTVYPGHELPIPDSSAHYQNLFSPQSPIGNHLSDPQRISGKSLIANDSADDDETTDLLKDPVAYAENGATNQRRATAPQIPISRMAGLSLNTGTAPPPGPSSLPPYINAMSAHPGPLSPMNGSGPGMAYPMSGQPYQRHTFPPVNPADQNPPCNTLYVGNLPIDTSEEELKAMFSKQRGYKRLCFRTKQNGPMCFVEFEDVSFATKALHELYGQLLHNSVKGGIRLSFSKNPLGVRSGQTPSQNNSVALGGMNAMMSGTANGFTTANGPPPGLSAPPGLGSGRANYHGPPALNAGHGHPYAIAGFPGVVNNGWNGPVYGSPMAAPPNGVLNNPPSSFLPPHMMGR